MAKLFVSEAAGRCADRAVQAFGGRGYLRTQRRRAVPARAARRPHLGGHQRDPAADHRPRARAPRRRGDDPLTRGCRTASRPRRWTWGGCMRPASIAVVGRHRPAGQLRRRDAAQPREDRLRGPGVGGQPAPAPRCSGRRACRRVADLPEPVDAVVVAIPAAGVPEVIEQAGARGCGGAVVFSAGFAEVAVGRRAPGRAGGAAARPPPAGVRPQLQRHRLAARPGRAVGRRAVGRGGRARGARLPERQRRRQRAGHAPRAALSHRDRQRQPGGADRRRLPGVPGRRGGRRRDRAVPGGRRRPAAVRRPGRLRRRPGSRWWC